MILISRSSDGHEKFTNFINDHIASEDSYVIVGEYCNDVVSFCLANVADNPPVFIEKQYGLVSDLAVSEPFRRKGIGERMFTEVQDWFKRKGIERIEVRVVLSREFTRLGRFRARS